MRYYAGKTNITTAVVDGTYPTGRLVAGASVKFRIVVKAGAGVTSGSSKTVLLRATSQGDGSKDAVRAVVSV